MNRSFSAMHLFATIALVALAGWLAMGLGNGLAAAYALIAALIAFSRSVDPEPAPIPVVTRPPQ